MADVSTAQAAYTAEMVQGLLDAVGEAITVQRPDGALVWANQQGAEMCGFSSPGELLAATVAEVVSRFEVLNEDGTPFPMGQLPGYRALAGEEPPEVLVRWRNVATGAGHWALLRSQPVRDCDGAVRFVVNVYQDVTSRQEAVAALRRSEERLRFLASASRALMAVSLDPCAVLARVSELAVPALADWCSVWDLPVDGGRRRVVGRLAPGHRAGLAEELAAEPGALGPALEEAVRRSGPLLFPTLDPAALDKIITDPAARRLAAELGPQSIMVVPVHASGRVAGALLLASTTAGRYGPDDLALAEDLARRAGLAIDIARAYADEQRARQAAEAATAQLRLLADLSRSLSSSLDLEVVSSRLVERTIGAFCDRCEVHLVGKDGIQQVAAAGTSTDPGDEAAVRGAVQHAETTFTVADDATEHPAGAGASAASITVPIAGRGSPLGALRFASAAGGRPLSPGDVAVAEEIGRRAGVAMENALVFAERAGAAATLARALLPTALPGVAGLEFAARYHPAAAGVGGDFYDVVTLGDGRCVLLIGDVCGKGPEAASLTAMARYTVRALAAVHADPARLLEEANGLLSPQLPEGRFCTLACVLVEPGGGPEPVPVRVTVALAGHPPPLVVPSTGPVRRCGTPGLVVGVLERLDLAVSTAELAAGDALVLFTDGCVGEGADAETVLGGVLRRSAGASADELADVVERVAAQVDPRHPDDVAVLVVRAVPGQNPQGAPVRSARTTSSQA